MLTTSTWHYLFGVVLLQEGIDVVLGVLEVACGVEGGVGEEEKSPSRHPEQRCDLRSDELTITYLSTETVISCNCLCFENCCPQNLKDMKKMTTQDKCFFYLLLLRDKLTFTTVSKSTGSVGTFSTANY